MQIFRRAGRHDRRFRAVWLIVSLAGIPLATGIGIPVAAGQSPPQEVRDPLNRDTPQTSVFSFIEACHSRNYSRARRYLDLRNLPEDRRSANGAELARQLAQILDRDARFDIGALSRDRSGDERDGLPPDRDLVESFNSLPASARLELSRVTLPSGLKVWLFSADSVQLIPRLAVLTSDSLIEKHLPAPLVNDTFMATPLWRVFALVLLTIVLAAISRWIARLAVFLVDQVLSRVAPGVNDKALKSLIAPVQVIFPAVVFGGALTPIAPSPALRLILDRALAVVLSAGVAWLCARVLDLCVARVRNILIARHGAVPSSVLPLFSRLVKVTIFLLAVTAILNNWGYNTSTILAGLGVGGLAIALAAQKTVENLFGGVAVISDRPVSLGDYCRFGDRAGTVEDIGLRSTRVRTLDRTLVTVPNGLFSAMTIENFTRRDKMLFHITLNLRRDTTPDKVRTLLRTITATLGGNSRIEAGPTPVRFVGVGAYSLDLEVFVYVLTRDGNEFLTIQQELLLNVLDQVESAGAALALPTQASVSDSLTARPGSPSQAYGGDLQPAGGHTTVPDRNNLPVRNA